MHAHTWQLTSTHLCMHINKPWEAFLPSLQTVVAGVKKDFIFSSWICTSAASRRWGKEELINFSNQNDSWCILWFKQMRSVVRIQLTWGGNGLFTPQHGGPVRVHFLRTREWPVSFSLKGQWKTKNTWNKLEGRTDWKCVDCHRACDLWSVSMSEVLQRHLCVCTVSCLLIT